MKKLLIDKSNWTSVKFGDVVIEPKESTKDPITDEIEHVVGLEHIDPENIHLNRSASIEESTTFTKKFSVGDVLFGRRRAYLKKAAQASFSGICSGDITVMRANESLLPNLLPFIANNEKFFDYAIKHSAGGLSPRVKFKDLANYEFLLPPKKEQAKLAKLLWAMDEVIEKQKILLEKVDLIQQVQTNELINSNKKHDSRIWKKFKLEKVAKIKSGGTPKRKVKSYWNGNIDWVKISDISNSGRYITKTEECISIEGVQNSSACIFPTNTVLLAMYASIGKTTITKKEMATSQAILGCVCNENILPDFLWIWLTVKRSKLIKMGRGGTQNNLNAGIVKNLNIMLPSIDEQINIVKNVSEILRTAENSRLKINSSKSLQRSLINQIF